MTRYKMIALDMDGTLLNEQSQISAANLQVIRECSQLGVTVCLSTGRGIYNVSPYIDEIQIELPIVAANGSEVWEHREKLITRITMDADLVEELRNWALQHDVWYWGSTTEQVFNKDTWSEDPYAEQWLKFGVYTENVELLTELRQRAEDMGRFEITNSHPYNLEFNPRGVNKAAGLAILCERLGYEMSQIIAVGDSLNDLAMIREAGLGIAMGNAQDEVKEAADMVTLSNNEDGVAHILRQVVLS
ncbi:5-amino-6-(5-phospho-D-ribitylamino)uracil phosphatase YcsE [Insulibacter thermoxylanivorax]|uniref:5-amino-6-(5-phospho-D-ribitylamino)uracil phosphatase YcsE n=1 Tax=Insulibacter thermoxylanivorax TaxID=2749268 RepID=A0A916VH69_9BACL|nr:Cof-type HAD-IIB family hydrolase [Insulibacter thermoxylanivorax]GFR39306.1 5-amino-6-(5-phospho-D-ribitylamino)uracil phosphatase YcsE [Insulibacter thermoxylanivorax]